MSPLDLVILGIVGILGLKGLIRGAKSELLGILAFFLALWAALHFVSSLAKLFLRFFPFVPFSILKGIGFVILFFVSLGVLRFFIGIVDGRHRIGMFSRILGLGIGMGKGLFWASFFAFFLLHYCSIEKSGWREKDSWLAKPISIMAPVFVKGLYHAKPGAQDLFHQMEPGLRILGKWISSVDTTQMGE